MTAARNAPRRGRPRRPRLDRKAVIGLPQVRLVEGLLDHLRRAYDHPNRRLHFDDLFIALLLAFYNPVVRSLRGVEDASQMPGVRQHLSLEAVKRSTASDALAAFDPGLLRPLLRDLRGRVSPRQMDQTDPALRGLLNRLLVYDGSFFRTVSDVGWALRERHGPRWRGRVRLNLHWSVRDGVPEGVSVAGRGDPGEPTALLESVTAGQVIVADRGCFSHETVQQLRQRQADFVLRLQRGVCCQEIALRPLTPADQAAGVLSDQTVLLTGSHNPYPPTPLRLVTIQPEGDSTRRDGASAAAPATPTAPLRLLTSLREAQTPAWVIGQVYRRRWEIELFFRWLKTCAQWEHLLSESRSGMLLQFYVALIGTLLLAVATGHPPDRYSFNLLCLAAAGQGSVQDALAIYERRRQERERDRLRQQARAAAKKLG